MTRVAQRAAGASRGLLEDLVRGTCLRRDVSSSVFYQMWSRVEHLVPTLENKTLSLLSRAGGGKGIFIIIVTERSNRHNHTPGPRDFQCLTCGAVFLLYSRDLLQSLVCFVRPNYAMSDDRQRASVLGEHLTRPYNNNRPLPVLCSSLPLTRC